MKINKLIDGIVGLDYSELLGDFYEEYFGGLYEDIYCDEVIFLFPQCSPRSIALLEADLSIEGIRIKTVDVILSQLGLPASGCKVFFDKIDTERFEIVSSAIRSRLFRVDGLFCHVGVDVEGALSKLCIYDVSLIQRNSSEFDENAIVSLLS